MFWHPGVSGGNCRSAATRALCFETVGFGVRTQPYQISVKRCFRSEPTESNMESPNPSAASTSVICKTENGYEEGCARGVDSVFGNATDPPVSARRRESRLSAFCVFRRVLAVFELLACSARVRCWGRRLCHAAPLVVYHARTLALSLRLVGLG